MIVGQELSVAEFVAAWPVPPVRAESGAWLLDLGTAGLAAWSMPPTMALAVHEVLVRDGFRPPLLEQATGSGRLVLFGVADVTASPSRAAVILRASVTCRVAGLMSLPDVDSDEWLAAPVLDGEFAGVGAVVEAIGLATPIDVTRGSRGRR